MTAIDIDKINILRQMRKSIYERGNSHNPEYWQVANDLDKYIAALEQGEPVGSVLATAEEDLEEIGSNTRCDHEAPETTIAVLTESITSPNCKGCSKKKAVNEEGYCWTCREVYGRGPD